MLNSINENNLIDMTDPNINKTNLITNKFSIKNKENNIIGVNNSKNKDLISMISCEDTSSSDIKLIENNKFIELTDIDLPLVKCINDNQIIEFSDHNKTIEIIEIKDKKSYKIFSNLNDKNYSFKEKILIKKRKHERLVSLLEKDLGNNKELYVNYKKYYNNIKKNLKIKKILKKKYIKKKNKIFNIEKKEICNNDEEIENTNILKESRSINNNVENNVIN